MAEFKNPNQDPDAQKRLIIVFALTFLAIIISQQLMERFGPKPAPKTTPTQIEAPAQTPTAPAQAVSSTPSAPAASSAPTAAAKGKRSTASALPVSKQAAAESETIV